MMNGTLPRAKEEHGVSLRMIGSVIGRSAATVLARINGECDWPLSEAHAVTAYFQTLDPSLTLDDLFGLEPLPPLADAGQLGGEDLDTSDGEEKVA